MVACLQVRSLEKELEEHKQHKPKSGRSGRTAVSVEREGRGGDGKGKENRRGGGRNVGRGTDCTIVSSGSMCVHA